MPPLGSGRNQDFAVKKVRAALNMPGTARPPLLYEGEARMPERTRAHNSSEYGSMPAKLPIALGHPKRRLRGLTINSRARHNDAFTAGPACAGAGFGFDLPCATGNVPALADEFTGLPSQRR